MNTLMKMPKRIDDMLFELKNHLNLSSKAAVARICVSLSLKVKEIPTIISKFDESTPISIDRDTLTGEHDDVIKAMLLQHYGENMDDSEYFPTLFYSHVNRGLDILHSEYRITKNKDKLIRKLLK